MPFPRNRLARREPEPVQRRYHASTRQPDVCEHEVLLARDARLRAERLEEIAERDEPGAAEEPDVHGDADARPSPCARTPRWSSGSASIGGSAKDGSP